MPPTPSIPSAGDPSAGERARAQQRYQYLPREENLLAPIAMARSWPWLREQYGPSWVLPFLPRYLGAWGHRALVLLRFAAQRATFRFDQMRAYRQAFPGAIPDFVRDAERDDAFAWWRVAGPNALGLTQERNLEGLRLRIPFDTARSEARLRARLGRTVSLETEAREGRLFAVDFRVLQSALQPATSNASPRRPEPTRDSRWREKYLPAPIGVFLEAPGFYDDVDLVPLAIQIDQPQPQPAREPNPVYTPDMGWAWRIAKVYFQAADTSFHAACGHVLRTHFLLEPFCLATPRQLSPDHPVSVLLRPHTRFTLTANQAAYRSFVDRKLTYFQFYSGTLPDTRQIAIQSHLEKGFRDLELETELASRGVDAGPARYPYRDDARLWLGPIREFVTSYLAAFYPSDASVREDPELQAWFAELVDGERGAVRKLVPGDRLDAVAKLVDVLAQVLFVAGPGHAAQHFTSSHFYRYAPAFAGAAYAPPPWHEALAHEARHANTLPPIGVASKQVTYNTFTNFRYDSFGSYGRHPLGRLPEAREPIRRLRAALAEVERAIQERGRERPFPYDFLLPSRVPNSINI